MRKPISVKTETVKEVKETKGKLEEQFRSGVISCSVFSREYETEKYGKSKAFSLVLQKAYSVEEDKKTVWKHTNSFDRKDIARIETVLSEAKRYLLLDEDTEEEEKD